MPSSYCGTDGSPLPRLRAGSERGIGTTGATAGANSLLRTSCGIGVFVTVSPVSYEWDRTAERQSTQKDRLSTKRGVGVATREIVTVYGTGWMGVVDGQILLPVLSKEDVWPGVVDSLGANVVRLVLDLQYMQVERSEMFK